MISYFAPTGRYAMDMPYAWQTVSASPLRVLGMSSLAYGSTPQFPGSVWSTANYWIDPIFSPTPNAALYSISGKVTGAPATLTLSGKTGAVTTTGRDGAYTFAALPAGNYVVAPSQSGYAFSPSTIAVSVGNASVRFVNFSATPLAVPHTATLTWTGSTSAGVIGYNVYRATVAGGPYTKVNTSLITSTSFVDKAVTGGKTYFYTATAVDSNNRESVYSTSATAQVPL